MSETFDHLVILGRPASGKSEFIEFLEKREDALRTERYHLGRMEGVDDFLWLWEKFLEDDIWEAIGKPRLYSKKYGHNYGLSDGALLDFCLEKFNQVVADKYVAHPEFYAAHTLLVEFSRGGEYNYAKALPRLRKPIWEKAAIFYLEVSYEESWRQNVRRYEEKARHSILAHMVPEEVHQRYYRDDDWREVTGNAPDGYLTLDGCKVPFVSVPNEPRIFDHVLMDHRYKQPLDRLWELYQKR
jgi:hypothetical protein